jgi:hypothetical protein
MMEDTDEKEAGGDESRSFERLAVEYPINLMVGLYGFDPQDHGFEAHGETINISRGGTLVRVRRPIVVNSRCLIHLVDGEGIVGRTLIYGTVKRSDELNEVFHIAIEFDNPLDYIRISLGEEPAE